MSELRGREAKEDMILEGILRPKRPWDQVGIMGSVYDMCQGAKVGNSLVRDSRLPCVAIEKKGWV